MSADNHNIIRSSGFSEKLSNANSKIIDHAIFISLLFSIPIVIGMYFRAIDTGLESLIFYQSFLILVLLLLFIARKKTSFIFKTISYLVLVLAAMFPYILNVGVLGFWIVDFFIIILIITVFTSKKIAYLILFIISLSVVLLAILFTNEILMIDFDVNKHIKSYNIWIGMIVTFIYVSILIISVIGMQRTFFISSIKDSITAKVRAQQNEQKFEQIFNSSNDGIMISDLKGNILETNYALSNILGIPVNMLMSKKTTDFVPQEYVDILKKRVAIAEFKDLPLIEIPVINYNGEEVQVEVNTILIYYNNEKALLSIIRNINSRKNTEREILKSVIRAEEKERSRFAKEIHDGIGPLLSAVKIYTDAFKNLKTEEEKEFTINKLNEIVNEAIISAKEISNNLSPHILRNFGLKGAVESFFQKINQNSKMAFTFKTNLDKRLNEDIEVTFYRIIVEFINNSIKYANAKSIFIELMDYTTILSLAYADDGGGFDLKSQDERSTGIGLSNIKSRVKSLNGKIKMWSEPMKGFKADIKLKTKFFS